MMKRSAPGGWTATREAEEMTMADAAPKMRSRRKLDDSRSPRKPTRRLVVYTSNMTVQVARVESAMTRVTDITKKHGGFIEKSSTTNYNSQATLRLRVPVEKFYQVVRELGQLGTVQQKDISAADITRQFQDSSMRLNSARRLRARLYTLLKSDVKQKEKIKILKEISRLNEQIETLESRIKAMRRKAALSTIILRLKSLLNPGKTPAVRSPFGWVTALKPTGRSIDEVARIEYKAPPGFFENREKFAAGENDYLLLSPDGVKVRSGRIENYPEGTLSFWEQVLKREWKGRGYKLLNARNLQGPDGGRLVYMNIDDGLRSYYYAVAIVLKGDSINVVEVVFNDEAVFKKQRGAVDSFLNSIRVLTWQDLWSYYFY